MVWRGVVWYARYGKLVTIAHDGGFSTRYGHCSVITAKVGQVRGEASWWANV